MIEQPSQAALLRGAFCAILLMAASYAHAEVALVVGANSPIDQVSKQQAIDVYTGKANAFMVGQLMWITTIGWHVPSSLKSLIQAGGSTSMRKWLRRVTTMENGNP